jgi:HTH-type transcriptional repressor of NAD biosynthesis genes
MADYSKKEYLLFDLTRTKVPISATQIKENPLKYWDYLTPAVKRSYAHHICICGTESSGKTTLATALEKEFEYVTMIPEIGRCLVGNAMTCEPTTLTAVLSIHKTLLKRVMQNPPTPIVVWDTDNLTTKSYMKFLNLEIYTSDLPIADIYIFLDSKIPYEKDITRVDEEVAEKLKNNHLDIYKKEGVNLYVLKDKENIMESMKQYVKDTADNISSKLWN